MAVTKNDEERRLLQLQSRELTLRSKLVNGSAEHSEVKAAIQALKLKISKGRK